MMATTISSTRHTTLLHSINSSGFKSWRLAQIQIHQVKTMYVLSYIKNPFDKESRLLQQQVDVSKFKIGHSKSKRSIVLCTIQLIIYHAALFHVHLNADLNYLMRFIHERI